jgi:dihydrofolate synthase/folylpolyglutamate synthase
MPDSARSSDPAVQHQLDRLAALSPGGDVLGLDRITRLLARLGDPHLALPPVLHVAGTNGKGSTCAFLRAALEAAGHKVHVYTSPHLVRFNERIRLGGTLIDDAYLASLLSEVFDAAGDIGASFFEVTTAAAFLAFSRTPADAVILEVGLGGRLDATNVVPNPLVTGIAQLGLDHQAFLGSEPTQIAAEKAGIAKRGAPLVTRRYPQPIMDVIDSAARSAGATWLPCDGPWDVEITPQNLRYSDRAGTLVLPVPRLPGIHQAMNAALAVAMIRHQHVLKAPPSAFRAAMGWTEWPARLQKMGPGPLVDRLPPGSDVWLDGGHNPSAARVVAAFIADAVPADRPFHVVCGLLENKDAEGVVGALAGRSGTFHALPVPGHAHHAPARLMSAARGIGMTALGAKDPAAALGWIARHADKERPPAVLIMGSLYLAGEVLAANGQAPS